MKGKEFGAKLKALYGKLDVPKINKLESKYYES